MDHTGIALPSLLPYVAATFAAPDQVILVFALLACHPRSHNTSSTGAEKRSDSAPVDTNAQNRSRIGAGAILDVYNLSLAVFLFVSPWLFAYANGAARFDLWASSTLIAVLSAAAIVAFSDWEEWLNLLLGIWLISAPWLLGYAHTGAMPVSTGVGVMLSIWPDFGSGWHTMAIEPSNKTEGDDIPLWRTTADGLTAC